ncbi:MAG: cation:proton antiporter [Acidimicrobiia bacterium]|nr:cation:proton antiporter [Acidimicrobiia bacterium]
MTTLAVIGAVIAVVSLFRERLRSLPLTTPMLFVAAGMILAPEVLGLAIFDDGLEDETIALIAEVTLALLLFSDAARIDTRNDSTSFALPARLLGIGLPLTVALGTLVTALLLTDLSWAEAALIAAILAPTDAALGEAVVANPAVPVKIRQALNVESGLNDGLVVPVIAVFSALAAESELEGAGELVSEAFLEIGIALIVGAFIAWLFSVVVPFATGRGWSDAEGFRIVALGAGVMSFAGSLALGGNGFVAAFVCGLLARRLMGPTVTDHAEFAEDVSQVGAAAVFLIFGGVMVWPALELVSPAILLCAIGTLTIGRMLPVAIAMIGTGLMRQTVTFLGWFGPRGLASMLFGLLLVSDSEVHRPDELFAIISLVVLCSVVLHGMTASPGARRYGAWYASSIEDDHDMMEAEMVIESPLRWIDPTTATKETP